MGDRRNPARPSNASLQPRVRSRIALRRVDLQPSQATSARPRAPRCCLTLLTRPLCRPRSLDDYSLWRHGGFSGTLAGLGYHLACTHRAVPVGCARQRRRLRWDRRPRESVLLWIFTAYAPIAVEWPYGSVCAERRGKEGWLIVESMYKVVLQASAPFLLVLPTKILYFTSCHLYFRSSESWAH